MTSHDPYEFPDVTISGPLALALAEVLEWADHRTHAEEDQARTEIFRMRYALEYEIRDAAPPMRWVLPKGADALPASLAARDEVRSLPVALPARDLSLYRAELDQAVNRLAAMAYMPTPPP